MAGIKRTGEQNKCQNSRQRNKTTENFRYNDNTDNVARQSILLPRHRKNIVDKPLAARGILIRAEYCQSCRQ